MKKKIRFYKKMVIEILETLCTICLYLESQGGWTHNQYSSYMRGHFNELKDFSLILRGKPDYTINDKM